MMVGPGMAGTVIVRKMTVVIARHVNATFANITPPKREVPVPDRLVGHAVVVRLKPSGRRRAARADQPHRTGQQSDDA